MNASASTDDLPAPAAPADAGPAGPPAVPADPEPQEAHVHIHLDLDTDAGMARARALLSGLFANVGVLHAAPVPLPVQQQPALPPAQAAAPQPALLQDQAAAIPMAPLPPLPQVLQPLMPGSQQALLIQQLLQNSTPRRRPGRPSRAETELRTLMASMQPQSAQAQLMQPQLMQPQQVQPQQAQPQQAQPQQAQPQHVQPQVQPRMVCRICTQPRADSVLRSCGHLICRACVLPYLQLRPVCPVGGCGRPTTITDVLHCN